MKHQTACLKALIDQIIFLEFSSDEQLDPDTAIAAMEDIAARFSALDLAQKKQLSDQIRQCASDYQGELAAFVETIPLCLRLENDPDSS